MTLDFIWNMYGHTKATVFSIFFLLFVLSMLEKHKVFFFTFTLAWKSGSIKIISRFLYWLEAFIVPALSIFESF